MRRFSVMSLMTLVMVAAICFKGYLEWDRRYGSGSQCWLAAKQWEAQFKRDLHEATKLRACPKRHSPWNTDFFCPACISCPVTPLPYERGQVPHYVPNFLADSDPGRELQARYLERHEAVAREYLAEAALCDQLRQKYVDATYQPTVEVKLIPAEQQLQFGARVSEKYRSDSY
jgi:hypothetical protein